MLASSAVPGSRSVASRSASLYRADIGPVHRRNTATSTLVSRARFAGAQSRKYAMGSSTRPGTSPPAGHLGAASGLSVHVSR